MGASVDTSRSSTDALALVTSGCPLTHHRDLAVSLDAKSILMPDHRDVAVGTVCSALPAADAMIFDHYFLIAFPKDRIDRTAHQTVRVGAGSA